MSADRAVTTVLVMAAIAGIIGCAREKAAPRVALGAPCAACGMTVSDVRFACLRDLDGRSRSFDSIECLRHVGPLRPDETAYLADYDTGTLHPADSLWVVHGAFPSPMGAGLAAFLDRVAADRVAADTRGRVARLWEHTGDLVEPAANGSGGARR